MFYYSQNGMKKIRIILNILSLSLLLFLVKPETSLSYEECDSIRYCTGRALNLTVNKGKGAHYVDVPMSQAFESTIDGFTAEMWLKPERQDGKREFIAGVWGPLQDVNDSWVVYISESDELVFEIDGPALMGSLDNTIARMPAANLYNKWSHVAVVFDGSDQSAYIYVDGILGASATNVQYPANNLQVPKDNTLPLQIGSCNALLDDLQTFRTFRGWIDEVRIWNFPMPEDEIYCNKDLAMSGAEEGLILYFRCNETPNVYNLCDASGSGHTGRARSGARCKDGGGRPRIRKVFVTPNAAINEIMKCDTTITYNFKIQDTSICGSTYGIRILDDKVSRYTITPNRIDLAPKTEYDFSVKIDRTLIGPFQSRLYIYPFNNCGVGTIIPIKLDRWTELGFSSNRLDMGELYANCEEVPYTDSIFTICNRSGEVTSSRSMRIDDITTTDPLRFEIILPAGLTLPYNIADGECIDITVRFHSANRAEDHFDTLFVKSDDQCYGSGIIPIEARTRSVLGIFELDGKTVIDSIEFDKTCTGFATRAFQYLWANLIDEDIYIDTILVPEHFVSQSFKFDVLLEPVTGYRPNYLRFAPEAPGVFLDSIVFVVKAGECNIRHPIYVTGEGFFADLRFKEDTIDFGKIIVGQSDFVYAEIANFSTDDLDMSSYVGRGDVFFTNGARQTLSPGETASVPLIFKPLTDTIYEDRLCFNELTCFNFGCIPIKGEGIYERFRFNPEIMRTESVLACDSRLDTLWIVNISPDTQTLELFDLNTTGKYELVIPAAFPASLELASGDSVMFIFRFTPNDFTQDIVERASLRFVTIPDLTQWEAPMYGTSSLPKIFVTGLTKFSSLEVGDSKRKNITIENINKFDIKIDSIITSEGYTLIKPSNYPNVTLKPREQIIAEIEFAPTEEKDYNGEVEVFSSSPCDVSQTGVLEGKGIIIPLEVPISVISFGFVRPCDCLTREMLMINQSMINNMNVDSIWIDDFNIQQNARPELFTWTSTNSPDASLPYQIPPMSFDTVKIKFCPRTPSEEEYIDNNARIHVAASGAGWEGLYDSYLFGKRTMNIYPQPAVVTFPPTQVDTFSIPPEQVYIIIPGLEYNPDLESVRIDSITFEPDDRVFSVQNPMPIEIDYPEMDSIIIDFRPRAARYYSAKMRLHMSKPCPVVDTTVLIEGNAFAPPYGLELTFENDREELDTFRFVNCALLDVPVYTSREFPAEVVDITCIISYDKSRLEFVSSDSPYLTADTCFPHIPSIIDKSIPEGMEFLLKNFCHVNSTKPILNASFRSLYLTRDTLGISIDSSFFDTEEVILYEIIAEYDSGMVVILKPEYEIQNEVDFGRVDVLDCLQRTLEILNTGDVDLSIDSLFNLPEDVKIVASVPDLGENFSPGETAIITIEFCPRRKQLYDIDSLFSESISPCILWDTTNIRGEGFAPPFEFGIDVTENFSIPDEIEATIGDTIQIPIYFERNFSRELNNIVYWLEGLRFNVVFDYNKYSMKYLSYENNIGGDLNLNYAEPGKIRLDYSNVDSLWAGEIANLTFLMLVPDSVETSIYADALEFDTDSILFLDIIPIGEESLLKTIGRCNLTSLNFDKLKPQIIGNAPNPWTDETKISFVINEKSSASLKLFSSTGEPVKELLDGSAEFDAGHYTYTLSSMGLQSGMYYIVLRSGADIDAMPVILIK